MSLSNKNRVYGLVFGGILSDTMGALVSYSPNIKVEKPSDSNLINIKEGYWTEPTTLWINTFSPGSGLISATGIYSKSNIEKNLLLSKVLQVSAITLNNINNFDQQLKMAFNLGGTPLEKEVCKIWTGIIDIVLHGAHKKTILDQTTYSNIEYDQSLNSIFPGNKKEPDDLDLQCIRDILTTFKVTNNFTEGLIIIVNNSVRPAWCSAIYGQLAGAYYGLTDIPETWLDNIQASDQISEIVSTYFQKMSTEYYAPMN